jgi:hypothetical protein
VRLEFAVTKLEGELRTVQGVAAQRVEEGERIEVARLRQLLTERG